MEYIIDTETTGLHPALGAVVIEIAVAKLIPYSQPLAFAEVQVWRFRPTKEDMARADAKALKVNGYYEGHPDWEGAPELGSPEAAVQWETIRAMLHGQTWIGQNANFDIRHVRNMCARHSLSLVEPDSTLDTRAHCRVIADCFGLKTRSLEPCYDALGMEKIAAHRAEVDVRRCLGVMNWVANQAKLGFTLTYHRNTNTSPQTERVATLAKQYLDNYTTQPTLPAEQKTE